MLTDSLNLRLSDDQYCLKSVSRVEDNASVCQLPSGSGIPSAEKLSRFVDSTQLGLPPTLLSIDSKEDQAFFAQDVARGFFQLRTHFRQESPRAYAAFQELIHMISTSSSGADQSSSFPLDEHSPVFLAVERYIRLATILYDEQSSGMDMYMNLHEYNENQLNSACPIEDPVAFLFKPASRLFLTPHSQARVSGITGGTTLTTKWLHTHQASKKVIMSLAVKYELDHRFVSRVFSLGRDKAEQVSFLDMHYGVTANAASAASSPNNSNSTSASSSFEYTPVSFNLMGSPSIERPMWVFMVVPILRLSEHSKETLRKYQAWLKSASGDATRIKDEKQDAAAGVEIIVEHCNLAMFVSGIAEGGSVISFSSEWVELMQFNTVHQMAERTSNWCCRRQPRNILDGSSSRGSPISKTHCEGKHTGATSTPSDRVSAQMSIFSKTLSEIRFPDSPLKSGNAHTFALKVLDDTTADYKLIVQAYEVCFLNMDRRFDEYDNITPKEIERLKKFIAQLSQLDQVVRPVADIIATANFKRLWISGDRSSVSGINLNLACVKTKVSHCTKQAEWTVKQYTLYSENKARFTFKILALASGWFIPVCALLKYLCGKIIECMGVSSMPTFTWEHQYSLFWCILMCIASYIFIVHRR